MNQRRGKAAAELSMGIGCVTGFGAGMAAGGATVDTGPIGITGAFNIGPVLGW